jgi:pSer/pThr/pTyr-binding forkhead associated (FHA) protein
MPCRKWGALKERIGHFVTIWTRGVTWMSGDLYLVIRREQAFERIHRIEAGETIIGRTPTSSLCLPDPLVSRRHAAILATTTGFLIRDLGSRNGTRLNSQTLGEGVLAPRAVVEIGPFNLKAYGDLALALEDTEESEDSTRHVEAELIPSIHKLTPAQRRVYDGFLHGFSEKEIATTLEISVNTVHTHSRAIYAAFGVSSRAELLALRMRETLHQ